MSIDLDREMEKMQIQAFIGKNSAFLSALLFQLKVVWDKDIDTACANSTTIRFNPDFMMGLKPKDRGLVLIHELWHVARMHQYRRGNREPAVWNIACDFRINNDMINDGYPIDNIGIKLVHDTNIDPDKTEEEIYRELLQSAKDLPEQLMQDIGDSSETSTEALQGPPSSEGKGSSTQGQEEPEKASTGFQKVAMAVNNAAIQAQMSDKTFSLSSLGLSDVVRRGLVEKIRWEHVFYQWFDSLQEADWTWSKPNRRHEMYLPSIAYEEAVDKVNIWLDSSGSMTEKDVSVVLSTIRNLVKKFNGIKIDLHCFDTTVHRTTTLDKEVPSISITGRGGTDIKCVVEAMATKGDEIHIIISDMYFDHIPLPGRCKKVVWMVPEYFDKSHPYKHKVLTYA